MDATMLYKLHAKTAFKKRIWTAISTRVISFLCKGILQLKPTIVYNLKKEKEKKKLPSKLYFTAI